MLGQGNVPMETSCREVEYKAPSLSDRLQTERQRLEARLEEVKAAQAALDRSPEVKDAVDAIAKLGHI